MTNGPPRRVGSLPASMHGSIRPIDGNRERPITDCNIQAPKHPEPFMSIPAQNLVDDNCRIHCGMVRKENKFRTWQDRYLVLHKGCMYYYKDSRDKSAKGQFSLSGYRLSTAPERLKFQWTFKMSHIQPEKRTYYFAAHSEKELNGEVRIDDWEPDCYTGHCRYGEVSVVERFLVTLRSFIRTHGSQDKMVIEWFEKIQEDMAEYCEPLGTRSGYSPVNVADEDSGSSEDGDVPKYDYDYPIVDAPDVNKAKEFIIKQMRDHPAFPVTMPGNQGEPTYCPPPDFGLPSGGNLSSLTAPPPPQRGPRSPSPLVVVKTGKASVDVSSLLQQQLSAEAVQKELIERPIPVPRTRGGTSAHVLKPTGPRQTPPTRPKPLSKPELHKCYTDSALDKSPGLQAAMATFDITKHSSRSSQDLEEEGSDKEDYLQILPDDQSANKPKPSTLERMRPEGKSFHKGYKEANKCKDVLPPSAKRLDLDKSNALLLLSGHYGLYMLHKSSKGDINQCLSVCTGDKVRHFLIFANEEAYALHHTGPWFASIGDMLGYYYKEPLPNQISAKLLAPYK